MSKESTWDWVVATINRTGYVSLYSNTLYVMYI